MPMIKNPILRGFNPDPSICRAGDDFYIATSTFEWYPGVQIHHSTDLANWRLVRRPLNRASLLDLTGVPDSCGVWAPCLSYEGGIFWLCYTVVTRFDGDFKDTHNFLTWSPKIEGDWSDPIPMNSSGFDPSLFHDGDGRKWHLNMVWNHRPDHSYFGGIVMQEYSHKQRRLIGDRKIIFKGTATGITEGPHLYKRGDYYYLMTAEGGTGCNHAITLARSKNIWGPYEVDPDLHIMTARDKPGANLQRTGHGSIVEDKQGQWCMAHLCSRPLSGLQRSPLGRETALQKVNWADDGWLRLSEPETAYDAGNTGELQDITYDFSEDGLHPDFQWLRVPDTSGLFSLSERKGALRVFGRDSIGSLFHSALVARRQQHFNYEATTVLEYSPTDFQQMAGLVAYYNAHKFHYLHLTYDDNRGRVLQIMSCLGDRTLGVTYPSKSTVGAVPATGKIWLKVRIGEAQLQFSWSADGRDWNSVGGELDASILSDEAGKGDGANFTGAFVGMACQDLTGQRLPADFTQFRYREL